MLVSKSICPGETVSVEGGEREAARRTGQMLKEGIKFCPLSIEDNRLHCCACPFSSQAPLHSPSSRSPIVICFLHFLIHTLCLTVPPSSLSKATSAAAIALGNFHTCVLLSGGGVICRGNDDYGQLGIGSTTNVDSRDQNLKTVDFGTGWISTASA